MLHINTGDIVRNSSSILTIKLGDYIKKVFRAIAFCISQNRGIVFYTSILDGRDQNLIQ